ncbi:cell wall metabolism sensor histidine kinase WalK, partial [Bacillus cytotoxicus]
MKKVGFFQSIHFKFVLIYMLLILIAMQVIGVYFVRELEKSLVQSFKDSLTQQTNLLSYNLKQEFNKEFNKERDKNEISFQQAVNNSIEKFAN